MITLGLTPEDELLILQAQTLVFAIQNQSRLVESDPWTFGPLSVRAVIERKPCRQVQNWKKTWKLDGHRIGFNALLGEIRDHQRTGV